MVLGCLFGEELHYVYLYKLKETIALTRTIERTLKQGNLNRD